jgi:hypothetical protein
VEVEVVVVVVVVIGFPGEHNIVQSFFDGPLPTLPTPLFAVTSLQLLTLTTAAVVIGIGTETTRSEQKDTGRGWKRRDGDLTLIPLQLTQCCQGRIKCKLYQRASPLHLDLQVQVQV